MNVLIIDNSILFHELLDGIFADSGMTPIICHTAAQARVTLNTQNIDFICISLYLEDEKGIELTESIRAMPQYKHTPLILLTSEESNELYTDALTAGVTEVFHKKDVPELVHFIQRFTSQQQALSGHVLYIEDTVSQRELVTQILSATGLTVNAFSTAEEAWQSYMQHDYDLVITDIILEGGMTGMALTNRIRRLEGNKGDIPILAMTGFDDISRRIELFYLGVSDYIIKPLLAEELIARVRNLVIGRHAYMESISLRQQAESANKAKSQFIADLNHELRTPLNAILGFSELLATDTKHPLSESQQDDVNEITHAGNYLLTLIGDILDISKIESGDVSLDTRDVNLSEIVANAITQVTTFAHQHAIEINAYSIPVELTVNCDALRLQQIIMNLLSNAVKYNQKQGHISILCKLLENGMIRLAIKDTGIGLSEEQQQQLFIPFNRLGQSESIEGTGLGLVICRRLTEAMGGEIGLKSNKGEGSTFWVDLPAS